MWGKDELIKTYVSFVLLRTSLKSLCRFGKIIPMFGFARECCVWTEGNCVFYSSWRQKNDLSIFFKKIRIVVQKPQENNQDIKTCLCQLLSETLAHNQTQSHRLNRDFLPIEQSADFFDYHTIYFSILWLVHYCFHMLDFFIIRQLPL